MNYQSIINSLFIIVISMQLISILCFTGIGIYTHKRDKKFEKTMQEYKIEKECIVKNIDTSNFKEGDILMIGDSGSFIKAKPENYDAENEYLMVIRKSNKK